MKIDTSEFLEVLESISPGLSDVSIIETSDEFVFNKNIIYTFNERVAVTRKFESGLIGSVNSKKLYNLIKKIKLKEIDISVKNDNLILKTKKMQASLKVNTKVKTLPLDTTKLKFNNVPEKFIEGINLCKFSVKKDIDAFPLNCIYIDLSEIKSSDNYRLSVYKMEKQFNKSFFIPHNCIQDVINYNPIKYCITKEWLHFKNNNTTFSINNIDQEFPDVKHLFKVNGNIISFAENSKKIIESIERAGIISDKESYGSKIDIEIYENNIHISGKCDIGWIKEKLKIEYNYDPISFSIIAEFFKEILSICSQMIVGENSILFENENFKHVLAKYNNA